jgi:hypothetical protein
MTSAQLDCRARGWIGLDWIGIGFWVSTFCGEFLWRAHPRQGFGLSVQSDSGPEAVRAER